MMIPATKFLGPRVHGIDNQENHYSNLDIRLVRGSWRESLVVPFFFFIVEERIDDGESSLPFARDRRTTECLI